MKRKIQIPLLALIIAFGAGCGNRSNDSNPTPNNPGGGGSSGGFTVGDYTINGHAVNGYKLTKLKQKTEGGNDSVIISYIWEGNKIKEQEISQREGSTSFTIKNRNTYGSTDFPNIPTRVETETNSPFGNATGYEERTLNSDGNIVSSVSYTNVGGSSPSKSHEWKMYYDGNKRLASAKVTRYNLGSNDVSGMDSLILQDYTAGGRPGLRIELSKSGSDPWREEYRYKYTYDARHNEIKEETSRDGGAFVTTEENSNVVDNINIPISSLMGIVGTLPNYLLNTELTYTGTNYDRNILSLSKTLATYCGSGYVNHSPAMEERMTEITANDGKLITGGKVVAEDWRCSSNSKRTRTYRLYLEYSR